MENELALTNENLIHLHSFPYQWVPLMNLFDPEIPGFPLYRVHFRHECKRIFGVPITFSIKERTKDGTCTLEFHIFSNINLDSRENEIEKRIFTKKLEERFGLTEALTKDELKDCCHDNENWKKIVDLVFPQLSKYYGDTLPCGQFYPKLFGIIRFISAWNTIGGRKQEFIMMNNVLNTIGEEIPNKSMWEGLNFRLMPTYEEVLEGNLNSFPNFKKLRKAIMEYGDLYLTREYNTPNLKIYLLENEIPVPKDEKKWDSLTSNVTLETKKLLTQIKEDFNRNYQRTFFFITYI